MVRLLVVFGGWSTFVAASLATADEPASAPQKGLALRHCLVTVVDDVKVSALRSGLLTAIDVREGGQVTRGADVGRLDDAEARFQLESADAEHAAAVARSGSQLEIAYAEATHQVAEAEHKMSLEANQKQPGAISLVELERQRLAAKQALIKIELSRFELDIRKTEAGMTGAKAKLARLDLEYRHVRAPLDGEVAEIYSQPGEWIEAGKPLLRIVRLDRLRVEGFIAVGEALPGEVLGRSVRVHVELARGRRHEFAGKVTFVSPIIQAGGEYRIWADVENRRERGEWLLRPGLPAEMIVEF